MSWKFVYNPRAADGFERNDSHAREKAEEAGYKFYMWGGSVRFTSNGEPTGILEKDMI